MRLSLFVLLPLALGLTEACTKKPKKDYTEQAEATCTIMATSWMDTALKSNPLAPKSVFSTELDKKYLALINDFAGKMGKIVSVEEKDDLQTHMAEDLRDLLKKHAAPFMKECTGVVSSMLGACESEEDHEKARACADDHSAKIEGLYKFNKSGTRPQQYQPKGSGEPEKTPSGS